MQGLRAVLLGLSLLLATSPAIAEELKPKPQTQEQLERLAREAAEKLMMALSAMLAAIPQYEMPELLPNGDIIIRRKLPPAPKPDLAPEQGPRELPGDHTET
jgi:hypothetical protein